MTRRLTALVVLFALAASVIPLWAVDVPNVDARKLAGPWPQWRGPYRDEISRETGLLAQWPEGGPALAWRASGLGKGFSSVSIADGKIFTMGDRDGGRHVIAVALADGKEIWKTKVDSTTKHGGYAGPRSTPTVDGALLYAVTANGNLVCLRTSDGKEAWRVNFPEQYKGKMHSGWGFSESPLVDGDRVVCTPGGPDAMIVTLDKKTGKEIWHSAVPKLGDRGDDGAGYSSIVIGNGAGVRQYVQLIGRGVIGVAAQDGKYLWGYNQVANGTANIPTPLISGDYVFTSTGYGDGGTALLKLVASGDGVRAEEQYYLPSAELQNHHGGMVMVGDFVYFGHGHGRGFPTCFDWKNNKVVWGGPNQRGPGDGSAAITYADGNVYFRYQDGTMALIGGTPDEYKVKGKFKIPDCRDPSWQHPVVALGKLYLREQDNLFCYELK